MLRIVAERGLEVTPLEATVFALGIHEDTGSLTFPTTTVRDVEAGNQTRERHRSRKT